MKSGETRDLLVEGQELGGLEPRPGPLAPQRERRDLVQVDVERQPLAEARGEPAVELVAQVAEQGENGVLPEREARLLVVGVGVVARDAKQLRRHAEGQGHVA